MVDVPVNSEVPQTIVDVVSDGQTLFDFDFRADAVEDLRAIYVSPTGVATILVGGVGFTAAGLGDPNGGTIDVSPLVTEENGSIAIYRSIEIKRLSDYSRDLFSAQINADMDQIYMILQDLSRDLGRSIKVAVGASSLTFSDEIPDGSTLKKVGDQILAGPSVIAIENAAIAAAEVLAAAAAAQGVFDDIQEIAATFRPFDIVRKTVGGADQAIDLQTPGAVKNQINFFLGGVYQNHNQWGLTDGVITPIGDPWPVAQAEVHYTPAIVTGGGSDIELPITRDMISEELEEAIFGSSSAVAGEIDLISFGLVGDGSDETDLFEAALSECWSKGYRKIRCYDPTRVFRVAEVDITQSVDIDLGGARLLGNFNVENANTCTTILKSSVAGLSISLKNLTIDGGNDGTQSNPSGAGGHPVILLTGAGADIYCENMLFKNGGNRNGAAYDHFSESLYGEFEVKFAKRAKFVRCKFTSAPGEVLALLSYGGNSIDYTLIEIDDCEFDKNRSFSPFSPYSSSSIVVYNAAKGSYVRNCTFGQHYKSAINWFAPGLIEGCRFYGVYDSQAIDFNEAGKVNIDNITVRACIIQNVTNGYAIRGSGRNIIIEDVEIHRCQNGIYIEPYYGGAASDRLVGVGTQRIRAIYNVWLRNIVSNGNDVVDGEGNAVDNTLIRVKGYSSEHLAYVHISGTGIQNSGADSPSANPEYGVWGENCVLFLDGHFQHGKTAMFYLTGHKEVVARNCQFHPQPGATTHMFLLDGGTVGDLVFEDCKVTAALDSGYSHIRMLSAPAMSGRIYRNRSGDISEISAGYPLTTNYTTIGTS